MELPAVNGRVLVLNQNFEPLNVCPIRRAFVLVGDGKAEVVEPGAAVLHTSTRTFDCPSVIRLLYLIKRVHPIAKLTRKELFLRDNYTCQYCGKQPKELTIDHVIPRHCGGPHRWDNLVSACNSCRRRLECSPWKRRPSPTLVAITGCTNTCTGHTIPTGSSSSRMPIG